MSERDLITIGFQPRGNGTLYSPGRITLTPSGDAYYRLSIELASGDVLTCHVAKLALKISNGEKP
jgi:hypothetical protein